MSFTPDKSDEIILIAAPEIKKVRAFDNHESMVDIRKYQRITLDKKGDWHSDNYHMVRKTVAEKLEKTALSLPEGINILFKEGHRSLKKQKELFDWYVNVLKKRMPSKSIDEIEILACEWVSPPLEDAPHSTGGAFDVTLIDHNGNEINMGSIVDDSSEGGVSRNKTHSEIISETGKNNRKILIDALTKQGFQNYPFEWWHWSYGDKYWAYFNKTDAFYQSIG